MSSALRTLSLAAFVLLATAIGAQAAQEITKESVNTAPFVATEAGSAVSAQAIRAGVLLDRAQASPGVIDGKIGDNFRKALAAFSETHDLPAAKVLSEPIWQALTRDAEPALVDYTITEKDIAGPFIESVPRDYGEMAKLKALSYTGPVELLASRFHMDERLLKQLNPKAEFDKAGTVIVVANVKHDKIEKKIARIDVVKVHGQVRALDKDGKLIVAYPATIGSEETPSPSGSYKVRVVAKNPTYTYNPAKNFKQGKNDRPLTIAAGPNNPVGSVFIALTKPTFGIHGTPEPDKIDKVGSHGCVRLTNWDAEQLAQAVKKGVPVNFVE